jgi:hypothetical protein
MANNLHISYDLYAPGQNYETVIAAIKQLGSWAKIQKSFWYVKSAYTTEQARNHVLSVMDDNDSVYVVDATNGVAAWHNIPSDSAAHIRDQWAK